MQEKSILDFCFLGKGKLENLILSSCWNLQPPCHHPWCTPPAALAQHLICVVSPSPIPVLKPHVRSFSFCATCGYLGGGLWSPLLLTSHQQNQILPQVLNSKAVMAVHTSASVLLLQGPKWPSTHPKALFNHLSLI